jgi:phosphoribosylformylglycinamidine cyclo-ligase
VSGTDGVGTKLKLAFALDRHDTVGIDLVAMSVNDILVQGAKPLYFLDYFACGRLRVETAAAVVGGVAAGCEQSGCALIGGETAEMPGMYPDGEYDLAGFAVGVVEKSSILDGHSIEPGDVVLGLASSGVHSNGFSLVRRILERVVGPEDEWVEALNATLLPGDPAQRTLADALMAPTRIYVQPMLDVLTELPGAVKAMAHITGGGLVENLPRVLPEQLQAVLRRNHWVWPAIFDWLQHAGAVTDDEMQRVFNCGIGMCVIVSPSQAHAVIDRLTAAGEIVSDIGSIQARPQGEAATVITTVV